MLLRDIWPSPAEVQEVIASSVRREMFVERYARVLEGDDRWRALPTPTGERFAWRADSTYVRRPPYRPWNHAVQISNKLLRECIRKVNKG